MVKKQKSSASDIKTLVGTDAIRKRPGMYIGTLGPAGVFRLFVEAVGNVLDLYEEEAASSMFVDINEKTKYITVSDDGYGIPVEKLEDIMTVTHTSGKFENNGFSIGMNGVGNKAINALSDDLVVKIKRDGKIVKQKYSKGKPISKIEVVGKTKETGTTFIFHPDIEILQDISINSDDYLDFLTSISYLNEGLTISYHAIKENGKEISRVLLSKNGIRDYLDAIEKYPLIKEPIYIEDKTQEDKQLKVCINYSTNNDDEVILSFVNSMMTKEHGTHVQGFRKAITDVFKNYIQNNNLLTKKDNNLEITGDDVRESLSAVIEVKWIEPMFDSQTKDNFTSKEAFGYVYKVVKEQLDLWLKINKNEGKIIANRIILAARGRHAAKRAKQATKRKDGSIFSSISSLSKYTKASSNDPKVKELFITEGQSAGGSASQGRNPETQAIYKLRGKPLNSHSLTTSRILANKEFNDIVNILNCGIDDNFNIENLTHDKIIFMADADIDGNHISCLLATFFFKHCPQLIEKGHVYVAQPPLYKIKEGKKEIYIKNKEEYYKYLNKKIIESFVLFKSNGEEYSSNLIENIFNHTRNYSILLKNLSSKFVVNKELIEVCAGYYDNEKTLLKLVKSKFKEIKANKKNNILTLSGVIDGEYQILTLNDNFINNTEELRNIYKEIKMKIFHLKNKKEDIKYNNLTLNEMLNIVNSYVIPKYRQRYKGLGKNLLPIVGILYGKPLLSVEILF